MFFTTLGIIMAILFTFALVVLIIRLCTSDTHSQQPNSANPQNQDQIVLIRIPSGAQGVQNIQIQPSHSQHIQPQNQSSPPQNQSPPPQSHHQQVPDGKPQPQPQGGIHSARQSPLQTFKEQDPPRYVDSEGGTSSCFRERERVPSFSALAGEKDGSGSEAV
ncbi:hypothetical protein HDU76_011138 [Blyttiomyces sp. JEL0837]|nr:hypothetical protein HDU76_011138 [Blyttiomyces sp. JEL0837]